LFAAAKAPKRFVRVEGGNHHNLTANFFDVYKEAVMEHFGLQYAVVHNASGGARQPATLGATR
jgi:hypothetical protein